MPFRNAAPVTRLRSGVSRPMIASAVTDFPLPLSPTSPTISPAGTVKDRSRTACTSPPTVWNQHAQPANVEHRVARRPARHPISDQLHHPRNSMRPIPVDARLLT